MAESTDSKTVAEVNDSEKTEAYDKLILYGLSEKVSLKLNEIYLDGKLKHEDLDDRALDALKEFPIEGAIVVLNQFLESNLKHVSNKSAYLCGVMKTYRQRKLASPNPGPETSAVNTGKGPNEDALKAILDRTGYTLDVTTGQRKYGGPPPNWDGCPPGPGCEVFCGKIPKDLYEDELIPLFEKCGKIWDLRLMMDPLSGQNRGYAFVTFTNREGAAEAVKQLDSYCIRESVTLKVNVSIPNLRLFVGNIPKSKSQEEIEEEFSKRTAGLCEVIIYCSPDDKKKNRGFCFLEYESHKHASLAKRRLSSGRQKVWGCEIIVDWADPQEEPDTETMSKVKVLYIRNLTQATTEEMIRDKFEPYGKVDRVKKLKDYAFVHFQEREHAVKAMDELQNTEIGGAKMEISLAKPPSDKKKKEEVIRNREKRLYQTLAQKGLPFPPAMMRAGGRGYSRGGGSRGDYGEGDYSDSWAMDEFGGYPYRYYDDFYHHDDFYYDYYSPFSAGGGNRGRSKTLPPSARGFGVNRGTGSGPFHRGRPTGHGGVNPMLRALALGSNANQIHFRGRLGGPGLRGFSRGANLAV